MTKLAFGDVLSESFRFFFGNLALFFRLVTVPWIMHIAIWFVVVLVGDSSIGFVIGQKVLEVIPTVIFMTAWMRVVLLGPGRVGGVPGLGWSARETAVLVHLVKVAGMSFALVAAMMMFVGSLDPREVGKLSPEELVRLQSYLMPLSLGALVSVVLALRVSFGIAGSAVDVPFSPRLSWVHGKGNGGTIIGVTLMLYILGNLVTAIVLLFVGSIVYGLFGRGIGALLVAWTATSLVSFAALGVLSTAQAIIFRTLLAWREGRTLPAVA